MTNAEELQKEADRRNLEQLVAPEPLTTWWLVRGSRLLRVPMDPAHMTRAEAQHARDLMDTYITRAEGRIQAHNSLMKLLAPYFVDDNTTLEEACRRAGLTVAEAWALAQAKGPEQ